MVVDEVNPRRDSRGQVCQVSTVRREQLRYINSAPGHQAASFASPSPIQNVSSAAWIARATT
jgi:hypothetical protein